VWKSGVVSHAQTLEELREEKYKYTREGFGGYGWVGDAHSHQFKKGDMEVIPDVYNPATIYKIFQHHSHGWMFGAVTIPRVRPVLLCQKM